MHNPFVMASFVNSKNKLTPQVLILKDEYLHKLTLIEGCVDAPLNSKIPKH